MEKLTYLLCIILIINLSIELCKCDVNYSTNENSHKKNTTAGSRYCGNSLVRAMRLICDGYYAEPNLKRSLDFNEQPKRRPNRKNKIWKQKYNLKDSDLTTWTELDNQYQYLFGSEVHQNNLPYIGFYSLPIKDTFTINKRKSLIKEEAKLNNLRRFKRGIYEECCAKPCTVKYMKSYCLNI